MRISDKGRDFIAAWEGGYRLKAYLCPAGYPTISAGVTHYPDGKRVMMGDTLGSDDEARRLFSHTLAPVEKGVEGLLTGYTFQPQFDALVSFSYNLGVTALAKSTLLLKINSGAPSQEIKAQFLRWIYADIDPKHPGLEESEGLLRRRQAEWDIYSLGTYRFP